MTTVPAAKPNHSPLPLRLSENTPRLGIMAAFGQEADLLLRNMKHQKQHLIHGKTFTTGTINDTPVVLVLSGISMTNAVMTTQMMIDHFNLQGLVFTGIAGSVNPHLHVGDVVIAQRWAAPGETYFANDNSMPAPGGIAGDLSCLGLKLSTNTTPYGNGLFLRDTNVINNDNYKQAALIDPMSGHVMAWGEMRTDFPVDSRMLQIATQIQVKTQAQLEPIQTADGSIYQPEIVLGQCGISSGAFLANADYRQYLYNNLSADCVDMETAAVAQTAYVNQLPFIAFRSLSDLAGADHDPNVGAFFASGVAQRNAATLTINFIEAWAISTQ